VGEAAEARPRPPRPRDRQAEAAATWRCRRHRPPRPRDRQAEAVATWWCRRHWHRVPVAGEGARCGCGPLSVGVVSMSWRSRLPVVGVGG